MAIWEGVKVSGSASQTDFPLTDQPSVDPAPARAYSQGAVGAHLRLYMSEHKAAFYQEASPLEQHQMLGKKC